MAAGSVRTRRKRAQVFTASGTFTPSPGVEVVEVLLVGGGGGGGAGYNSGGYSGGGGGGGGYIARVSAPVTGPTSVVVGAGGAGGGVQALPGARGGASSFGIFTVGGGYGGQGSLYQGSPPYYPARGGYGHNGGGPGTNYVGSYGGPVENAGGRNGGNSAEQLLPLSQTAPVPHERWGGTAGVGSVRGISELSFSAGGDGGVSRAGGTAQAVAAAAANTGNGGPGGETANTTSTAGGAGGSGVVIVYWEE